MHDFNLGIASSGVFWTSLFPPDSVEIDADDLDRARLCLGDLFVIDAHDIVSALSRLPADPSSVSFKVRWFNATTPLEHVRDTTNRFDLAFRQTMAAIQWSAVTPSFKFVSDPASTSVTDFAELGRERNGVFFS